MSKQLKHFSPDPETTGGGNTPTHSTEGIPRKDVDFMDVSKAVAVKWLDTPAITLIGTDAGAFQRMTDAYAAQLTGRLAAGSNRPSTTRTTRQLDQAIDAAVKEVKVYIERKFRKDNAASEFPRYGIAKESNTYRLPKDHNKRRAALQLMRSAITADGFDRDEYGSEFWQRTADDYDRALDTASRIDGSVSTGVSGKNNLKADIKKVMKSLRKVIEGNYPDSYKAVLRDWGWQKEDY